MTADSQSQGSRGRYGDLALHPAPGNGRPQRREQGERLPAKAGVVPNPLYEYVREQQAHQH